MCDTALELRRVTVGPRRYDPKPRARDRQWCWTCCPLSVKRGQAQRRDAEDHRAMNPVRKQQDTSRNVRNAAGNAETPIKSARSRINRQSVIITVSAMIGYVLSYCVCVILAYFNLIKTDHRIGRVLNVLFIPLGYLEQQSDTIREFFRWLTELLASPFF